MAKRNTQRIGNTTDMTSRCCTYSNAKQVIIINYLIFKIIMEKRTEEFVMDGVVVYEAPRAEVVEMEIESAILNHSDDGAA